MLLKYQISFLILLLSGCATVNTARHNLLPAALKDQTKTQVSQSKSFDLAEYQTFTVLPASTLSKDSTTENNNVLQMHLLFILRNTLEGRGYKFVKPSQAPDFIATIENFTANKTNYFATTISSKSKWQIDTISHLEAEPQWNNHFIWGEYHSPMTSSKHELAPSKTPQGLMAGTHYPQIEITFFSTKELSAVWRGVAIGASNNPVIQTSSQLIIRSLTSKVPISKHQSKNLPLNTGRIGVGYAIVTTDGKNYYPAITGLSTNAPAEKTGLRTTDFIIEINNVPTLNKNSSSISNMLSGAAGSKVTLKTWRMGTSNEYTLQRIQR